VVVIKQSYARSTHATSSVPHLHLSANTMCLQKVEAHGREEERACRCPMSVGRDAVATVSLTSKALLLRRHRRVGRVILKHLQKRL